jgi:hypothetical protein
MVLENIVLVTFQNVFVWKYIKIIYIFYFFKIIFYINLSKQFKNNIKKSK